MFWYRLSRLDRFLIAVSAVGLVLATIFIFEDRWIYRLLAINESQLEKIGNVKAATNDVRRRHGSALSWAPLEADSPVYQGDSIFTGENSTATILTDRGESIAISPNSLVVISAKTDAVRLDIDYGSVLGQIGKYKKLVIASKGDVTEFKGDDARIKVDVGQNQALVVNVVEGQVEVLSDDGSRTLGPNQQAEIADGAAILDPSDVRIDPLTPTANRVLKPDESRQLVLTWQSSYNFQDYTVEIAEDPDFKQVLLKEKVPRPTFRPPSLPTNQRLYWRVSGQLRSNQPPVRSKVLTFTLTEDAPPVVAFPRDQQRYFFEEQIGDGGGFLEIGSRWTPKSVSALWEVQLATSPDFSRDLKIFESREPHVGLGLITEGTYFLRVRAKDWSDALWSETIQFSIVRKAPANLKPPQVLTADDQFFLVTRPSGYSPAELINPPADRISGMVEAIPELAWNTIPGATSYDLEIGTTRDFSRIVLRTQVPNTRYGWNDVRIGQFYWRIRSVGANNQRGPFTSPQPLLVKLAPPQSLTPEKVAEEVTSLTQMESAPAPFLLRWSPILFAKTYELEFDVNPNFPRPLRVVAPYPFKKVQAPRAGLYYWRVRAFDTNGKLLTEWSTPVKYELVRTYLNPETTKELKALSPVDSETLMLIGAGENKITFRWISPVKSGRIRFQMSDGSDFSSPRLDFLTDKDFYLFRGHLPDGWHYWRLRVEAPQFTSPWTTAYRFQVLSEKSPFNFEDSEKKLSKELREFEERRKVEDQAARTRLAQEAEALNRQIEATLAQLEAPVDLTSPEVFILEARARPPSAPDLERLKDSEVAQLLREQPVLEWRPTLDATEYLIQIARDDQFKQMVESARVNRPSYRWLNVKPGKFYWRVRGLSHRLRPSAFSEIAVLKVQAPRPIPETPHTVFIRHAESPASISLKWSSVPYARFYEFEWSVNPDFAAKVSRVLDRSMVNKTIERENAYYWRVRPLDSGRQAMTEFSETQVINVGLLGRQPARADQPQLLFPRDQQEIVIGASETARLDFAWAQGSLFAAPLLLEVSKDLDFNEVVARASTKSDSALVELSANKGTFYWRLSTILPSKKPWTSPARSFTLVESASRKTAGDQ